MSDPTTPPEETTVVEPTWRGYRADQVVVSLIRLVMGANFVPAGSLIPKHWSVVEQVPEWFRPATPADLREGGS